MEFRYERVNEHKTADLQQLFAEVFHRSISTEYMCRKYAAVYPGKGWYGCLAYHKNKPVAFFGTVVVQTVYRGETVFSGQVVDSMTAPDYLKKGLYTRLAKQTFEWLQQDGVAFVWGFANQDSEAAVTKKLDFVFEHRLTAFRLTQGEWLLGKISGKLFPRVVHDRAERILKKYRVLADFKGSVTYDSEAVTLDRSPVYFAYKSYTSNWVIELEGTRFWVKISNGLLIGDVEYTSTDVLRKGMDALLRIVRKYRLGKVYFHGIAPSVFTQVLDEFQPVKTPSWSLCYHNFSCRFPLEKLAVTLGDIDTF